MNTILHALSLSLFIWIHSSYCHTDTPPQAPVFSLHRHVIISKTGRWKEVDLVYKKTLYQNLPDDSKTITECVRAYGAAGKTLFKCKEHIMLLRPESVINHWLTEQLQTGYINLTIKEFGLINTPAYISAVKPAPVSQKCYLPLFSKSNKATTGLNRTNYTTDSSCVTGTFKRHVNNAKSYTFKNLFTGRTETIHATPNHLFYVKNKHRFIALDKIAPTDELLTLSGYKMRLLCPEGKKAHCGMRWKKNNIATVYNLEVYKEHEYFAGNNKIYVHNIYFCLKCDEKYTYPGRLSGHSRRVHQEDDAMAINYKCVSLIEPQKRQEYNQQWQSRVQSIKESHPMQCNYCLHAFFDRECGLFRHINQNHTPKPSMPSMPVLPVPMQSDAYSLSSAAVIESDWLSSFTQDWNRILAETAFQLAMEEIRKIAPTALGPLPDIYDRSLGTIVQGMTEDIYRKMQGNQPMTQMEWDLPEGYHISEDRLPMISIQTAEQFAPS